MIFKSSVFKLILGSLSILGLAAATGVIYKFYVKPLAPTYFNVTLPANVGAVCEPMITFRDNSTNEDDFRLYRRNFGTIPFTMIFIFPASPGMGKEFGYTDLALPIGSYE